VEKGGSRYRHRAMLPGLARRAGERGLVVGLDFSRGMLERARRKLQGMRGVTLVRAEAAQLAFRPGSFDAVTCSHTFYVLKGAEAEQALEEVARILRPGGLFLMMEYEVREQPLIRLLFYIRSISGCCRWGCGRRWR
jgi:ubiquinone/menaquinone biosynthesis C-methylase UbiE